SGRQVDCLYVPANIPEGVAPGLVSDLRRRLTPAGGLIIGTFGTYASFMREILQQWFVPLLSVAPSRRALLLGRGAAQFQRALTGEHPGLAHQIITIGGVEPLSVAVHLQACDLVL